MTLTPDLLRWLQGDDVAAELQALTRTPPDDASLLSTLTRLRKRFTPPQASALVTTARLRQRARKKFGEQAAKMFFSDAGLQQASPQAVAAHTARRFARFLHVADLGCGLGSDSLALARIGIRVLSVDREPLALALTQANARALGFSDAIHPVRADVRFPVWNLPVAWADPGRRDDARRLFHPEALQPPLSRLLSLHQSRIPHLGIKLMPGLAHDVIPPEAEAEWISFGGDLKEAVLWLGGLAEGPGRRATVLPSGVRLWALGTRAAVQAPGRFLFEPDPAVIRAGAVGDLAQMLNLWQIDEEIAYLSGDEALITPFARHWRILEHHSFDLKWLNQRLRAMQASVTAVKKRGSPIEPEPFRRRLYRHPSGRPVVVVLTRVADRPWMLICE
jgi:SAM-dependent methyltransferase